jgi:hypothetical protein
LRMHCVQRKGDLACSAFLGAGCDASDVRARIKPRTQPLRLSFAAIAFPLHRIWGPTYVHALIRASP